MINALGCVLKPCARALELNALPTPIVLPGWSPVWSFLRRFFELPAKSFTERREYAELEYAELNAGIQFKSNKQIKLGFRVAFREHGDGCRSALPNYLRFGVKPESCTSPIDARALALEQICSSSKRLLFRPGRVLVFAFAALAHRRCE